MKMPQPVMTVPLRPIQLGVALAAEYSMARQWVLNSLCNITSDDCAKERTRGEDGDDQRSGGGAETESSLGIGLTRRRVWLMGVGVDGEVRVLHSTLAVLYNVRYGAHQNTINVTRVEPEEDTAKSSKGTL